MAYDPASLAPGDVILCLPPPHEPLWDRVLDDGIAISTVNPFTHSALVVAQHDQCIIVEALFRVTMSPCDKYRANGWLYHVDLTPAQRQALSQAALRKVGQLYGASMVWQDFLRDDLHLDIHPRLDPRHLDCSGFVAYCFAAAGVTLTYAPAPSPADLSYSPLLLGPRPWDTP